MTDAQRLNKQGVREALGALADIRRDIGNAERRAENRFGEAEAELMSLRKLRGFVDVEIDTHRARLRAIEDAEAAGKTE